MAGESSPGTMTSESNGGGYPYMASNGVHFRDVCMWCYTTIQQETAMTVTSLAP
jgi:hypothetical protein